MKNKPIQFIYLLFFVFLFSCTKKTLPVEGASKPESKKNSSVSSIKTAVPNVIVVNDAVASKTIDGRYYYDLNKKRYYRNNKDGKYYLFNKSMYHNKDFKPTKKGK